MDKFKARLEIIVIVLYYCGLFFLINLSIVKAKNTVVSVDTTSIFN